MSVHTVTKETFDREVLAAKETVLVDFWAPWCGPCRMLSPIVDEIAQKRTDIKVVKVNIDDEQELAERFRVMSIPTLMVVKGGRVTASSAVVRPRAAIEAMIG